jgi:hypothetical protein
VVEGSGMKYSGYCVKVKHQGTVVAQAASTDKWLEEAELLPMAAVAKKK